MEALVFPALWFCWTFSTLVEHIRTHGLTADPALHEKWVEYQRRKAQSK